MTTDPRQPALAFVEDPDAERLPLRIVEALLFASDRPLEAGDLASRLPPDADVRGLVRQLAAEYEGRGVRLVQVGQGWAFRTAPDLAGRLRLEVPQPRKLGRAAIETLAVIAYHQPLTRGEIENVRGVATSRGTLDALMETGWVRPGRRRQTPGRPLTWVTTPQFLDHFGLATLGDLPGVEELKSAGLLDTRPATAVLPGFGGGPLGEGGGEEDESGAVDIEDLVDLAEAEDDPLDPAG